MIKRLSYPRLGMEGVPQPGTGCPIGGEDDHLLSPSVETCSELHQVLQLLLQEPMYHRTCPGLHHSPASQLPQPAPPFLRIDRFFERRQAAELVDGCQCLIRRGERQNRHVATQLTNGPADHVTILIR